MKYSIITINLNNSAGLKKTIESVVNQTFQDFEYIIIDGGSTDGSLDIIKEYSSRIDYWVSEPDRGIYNAMNKGIIQAHGEYLNFMNSGDYFSKNTILEEIHADLSFDFVFGKARTIPNNTILSPSKNITLYSLCTTGFNHQALFVRRDIFCKHMFDEKYKMLSDWKFVVESLIIDNCSYKVVDIVVADYDLGGISTTYMDNAVNEQKSILKELLPERICSDYIFFREIKSPILYKLPFLSKRYRFERLIDKVIGLYIKVCK